MARKKKRRHRREVKRSTMEEYVAKHIKSATAKLRYLENKGGYKASTKAQQAKASLRMIYRKWGLDENSYHTGKTFLSKLKSNADFRVVYNAISDIRSIDTKRANLEYKKLVKEFSKKALTFDETFNQLSHLSSEFHEVFAFMTYNETQEYIIKRAGINETILLNDFLTTISDKILDDTQTERAKRLITKLENSKKIDDKDLEDIIMTHAKTINRVMGVGDKYRKYTSQSTRPVSKKTSQSTSRRPKPKPKKRKK